MTTIVACTEVISGVKLQYHLLFGTNLFIIWYANALHSTTIAYPQVQGKQSQSDNDNGTCPILHLLAQDFTSIFLNLWAAP